MSFTYRQVTLLDFNTFDAFYLRSFLLIKEKSTIYIG